MEISRGSEIASAGAAAFITPDDLPDFREYVRRKYGVDMEEDLVRMIEDLIERQKQKRKADKGASGNDGSFSTKPNMD